MLSATYALVALSVEQANVRVSVSQFQQFIDTQLMQKRGLDHGGMKYLMKKMAHLYERCHLRKIDLYLMRSVRSACQGGHLLLAELESLNHLALSAFRSVRERLQQALQQNAGQHEANLDELHAFLKLYCKTQLIKLEKEECELFALARRVLPTPVWFELAESFLLHETERLEQRRSFEPKPEEGQRPAIVQPKPYLQLGMSRQTTGAEPVKPVVPEITKTILAGEIIGGMWCPVQDTLGVAHA